MILPFSQRVKKLVANGINMLEFIKAFLFRHKMMISF